MYNDSHPYSPYSDTSSDGNPQTQFPYYRSRSTALDPLPTPVEPGFWNEMQQTQNTIDDGWSSSPQIQYPLTPNDDVISVSTSFPPNTNPAPDTVFSSSDNVFFYTTYSKILFAAPNAFESYLGGALDSPQYRQTVVMLDAPSAELNIILHAVYNTSPEQNSPDFETLVRAIDRMLGYGLSAETLIQPSSPLYKLLLAHAPLHPLDAYALAAHHKIYALAKTVSSHLLSHDLNTVSDAMAERIGAVYLMRLCMLHAGRFNALKEILLHPPRPHPATRNCGYEDQKKVTRAWALVSAYLVWDARADISTSTLSDTLNPILEHLTCKHCEKSLQDKIKDVMVRWTAVKKISGY